MPLTMTVLPRTVAFAIANLITISAPLVTTAACAQTAERIQPMNLEQLEQILESEVDNVAGGSGQWRFSIGDRAVIVLADAANDRMRVFSPVMPADELT
ncbi:MAG: hypothetical protein F6K31_26080, partial [Symploca sp. SIO2G7]|nr:hypothetical protein [Symploca sp. SIO2G7]